MFRRRIGFSGLCKAPAGSCWFHKAMRKGCKAGRRIADCAAASITTAMPGASPSASLPELPLLLFVRQPKEWPACEYGR